MEDVVGPSSSPSSSLSPSPYPSLLLGEGEGAGGKKRVDEEGLGGEGEKKEGGDEGGMSEQVLRFQQQIRLLPLKHHDRLYWPVGAVTPSPS
jgi:hypothetical protein